MKRSNIIHLFCLDNHRNFSDNIRKRFSDVAKYKITAGTTRKELIRYLDDKKEIPLLTFVVLILFFMLIIRLIYPVFF